MRSRALTLRSGTSKVQHRLPIPILSVIFHGIFLTRRQTARKLGVPIYQLLGGKLRDKLKVYAWIGGDRPGDVEAQAYGA